MAANVAPTSNEIEPTNPDDNDEEKKEDEQQPQVHEQTVTMIAQPTIYLLPETFGVWNFRFLGKIQYFITNQCEYLVSFKDGTSNCRRNNDIDGVELVLLRGYRFKVKVILITVINITRYIKSGIKSGIYQSQFVLTY